jgi:hypothetical protein
VLQTGLLGAGMSEIQVNIEEVIRNTRRYWYVDGLAEIAGGVVIILIALTYALVYLIPDSTARNLLLGIGQPALILLCAFYSGKLVSRLKQKITFPRTGLIKFRRGKANKRVRRIFLVLIIAAVVSALVSFFASMIPARYLPFLSSIFIDSLYLGYFNGVRRFYIVGVLIVLYGALISWLNLSGLTPYLYLLIGIGVIWVISGVWTLYRYLSQTQPMQEEI